MANALYLCVLDLDAQIFNDLSTHDHALIGTLATKIKQGNVSDSDEMEMNRIVHRYYKEENFMIPVTEPSNVINVDFKKDKKPDIPNRKESLNYEQSQAYDTILPWFKSESPRAGLFGAAGCGKTYTAQQVVLGIKDIKSRAKVCLSAPTNKATRILENFALNAGLDIETLTIHKLLGVAPERDDHGRNMLAQVQECSTHYYDLIILDECSMVSDLLLSKMPDDAKVLYMGDRFQLLPVETNLQSPCFDVFEQSNLITPVRYKGAILDVATAIRQDITAKRLPTIQTAMDAADQGIERLTGSKWLDRLIEAHGEQLNSKDGDSNAVRALAWRNDTVEEINHTVRDAVYGYDADRFVRNETLIASGLVSKQCSDPDGWASGSKWTFMNSSSECIINRVAQHSRTLLNDFTVELPVWAIDVTSDMGDETTLHILHEDAIAHAEKLFSERKESILARDKSNRKDFWKAFYEDLACIGMQLKGSKLTPILRSGFCQTVHQSQGSTYEKTFVASRDIASCKQHETRNRLLYVAITRASQYVGMQG